MAVSWRIPLKQHGLCLPCTACYTCFCLLSVPPTLCIGLLFAFARQKRRSRAGSGSNNLQVSRAPHAQRKQCSSSTCSGETLSFVGERRLWLRALVGFLGNHGLRDVGPIIWRFLDDHPHLLRVAAASGDVQDLPLRGPRLDMPPAHAAVPTVSGPVLGFLRGRVARAVGNDLALVDLQSGPVDDLGSGSRGSGLLLEGHQGEVTCFAVSGDGAEDDFVATSSTDFSIRLWRGGRCLQTLLGQEWSEWTGTMFIGHVVTITAMCVTAEGRLASGDHFGAVCVWHEDGHCQMLDTRVSSAVACMAPAMEGDGFLVGHASGEVYAASWEPLLHSVWKGAGPGLLALSVEPHTGGVLAACKSGLLQAPPGESGFSQLASFPEPAHHAAFDRRGTLIACGQHAVTLWALNGMLRATVREPDVSVAALLHEEDLAAGRRPLPVQE